MFVVLLFPLSMLAQTPQAEQWDLVRCVDFAFKNNISVRQGDLQSRFSSLTFNQSKAERWPSLNVGGNATYNWGRSDDPNTGVRVGASLFTTQLTMQSQVNLFNWFSQKNTTEANRLNWEADKEQTNKLKNDVALNVAAAYLQILLAKEQVRIAELQVSQTESQLENTRKRVDAGVLPELNAAELEAQLARDSSSLITAESTVQQSILLMKALLNLDAATPFDVVTPSIDKIPIDPIAELQPENVYALAMANMPQQKVNSLRIQSAQKSIAAAKGRLYPTLSAFGALSTASNDIKTPVTSGTIPTTTNFFVNVNGVDYNVFAPTPVIVGQKINPVGSQYTDNFGQALGVSLNVPIFNGRSARSAWDRTKLDMKMLELQKEQSDMQLKQDIYTAYNDAMTSLEQFNANKKTVETARKAYDYAQKRYDANLLSIYDLVNSRNSFRTALVQVSYAQYDYVFKMKVLEFYKGQGIKLQ